MSRRTVSNTEGVQTMPWGIRAYVKVGGHQTQKTFPIGTPLEEIVAWRMAQALTVTAPGRSTFGADVARFLATLTGRRRQNFECELKPWLERFVHKPRSFITREHVLATLSTLQAEGYAPSTLNHRRQALISLWRFLDGKHHACPALDVDGFDEGKPEPRAVDPALLERVFAAMKPGKVKARLLMIRWTGARPAEIATLTPERLVVDGPTPHAHYVTAKGGYDRVVPLSRHGLEAARLFVATGAWGAFSRGALNTAFRRAYVRAETRTDKPSMFQRDAALAKIHQGVRPTGRIRWRLSPYVLRHTFLTELRKSGTDLADVQAIAGHRSISTTMRYAPTVSAKLVDALARLDP